MQSPLSDKRIKTVQGPKHITHSLPFPFPFSVGPGLFMAVYDYGRDLLGETDSFISEFLVAHLLDKDHFMLTAYLQSSI